MIGIFTLDLLGGVMITWLIMIFATRFLRYADPSQRGWTFFTQALPNSDSIAGSDGIHRWQSKLSLWSFSALVGILSHVGFDLISHDTNLLLYPWYDNPHWFPKWWYIAWFEIGPLPMFGHSYAVGLFSVVWCILSIIGVVLFFRFLGSKHESRV